MMGNSKSNRNNTKPDCRCQTEERAAIQWADGLISWGEAHRLADSGEICVGCLGVYSELQDVRGKKKEVGERT